MTAASHLMSRMLLIGGRGRAPNSAKSLKGEFTVTQGNCPKAILSAEVMLSDGSVAGAPCLSRPMCSETSAGFSRPAVPGP